MAKGKKVADAYVSIIPSAEGVKGKLKTILESEGDSAGKSAGGKAGAGIVKGILASNAIMQLGSTVAGVVQKAFGEGASYEQNIGGIETLFKEASDKMIQYANDAYKTAGMSANQYMETTTSFAASMLSSVGGDAEKAGELANKAVIAISDNVNKMGSDAQSIERAYQGFAKQNYTMLDNLKLGYGGTKKEMERLLADASKISGIKFDINSFADITQAIQVIQDELGITGTTALEASETFSGSMASMQGAWSNLLAQMAMGGDVDTAMTNLAESVNTFVFGNALPMFGKIIGTIPNIVKTFFVQGIPVLIESGKELLSTIAQGFMENKGDWNEAVNNALDNAITWIDEKLPQFIDQGIATIENFIAGWGQGDGHMVQAVGQIIGKIIIVIAKAGVQILGAGAQIVLKLIAGFVQNIPTMLTRVGQMMLSVGQTIKNVDWVSFGRNIVDGIINGIKASASRLFQALRDLAKNALESAKEKLLIKSPSRVFRDEVGKQLVAGFALGITDNTRMVTDAMNDLTMKTLRVANDELSIASHVTSSATIRNGDVAMGQVLTLLRRYLPECAEDKTLSIDGRTFGRMVRNYA